MGILKGPRKSVEFSAGPDIVTIEPRKRTLNRHLSMERQLFEKYNGSQVTDSMLQEASQLFSEHYGVWGEHAVQVAGPFAKAGKPALTYFSSHVDKPKVVMYDSARQDFVRITWLSPAQALT